MSNQKQYKRVANKGDYQITGESSNGINFSKDGNNFFYSGNNEEYLQALREGLIQTPNNQLDINDPNNAGSYMGMFVQGGVNNINLGNSTQQTLNINNTSTTPQNVVQPVIPSPIVSQLPSKEPPPTPTPSSSPTKEEESFEDIQELEFEELPTEETSQIFEVIQVNLNIQDNVPELESPSVVKLNIAREAVNKNNGKVPKEGTDFVKYGSAFKLVQNDGTLGNQYYYSCALFNQGDPQWGSLRGGGYTLKAAGCCYCSLSMIATYHKNNAGYTPLWFWDNAKKSTVVYWSVMGDAVGLTGTLTTTETYTTSDGKNKTRLVSTFLIDKILKTKPLMFEWDNTNKASKTSYAGKYTKRHHWMIINGRNQDGSYTVFDPNGGRIWRNQTKEAIEAGLIRIFYF